MDNFQFADEFLELSLFFKEQHMRFLQNDYFTGGDPPGEPDVLCVLWSVILLMTDDPPLPLAPPVEKAVFKQRAGAKTSCRFNKSHWRK